MRGADGTAVSRCVAVAVAVAVVMVMVTATVTFTVVVVVVVVVMFELWSWLWLLGICTICCSSEYLASTTATPQLRTSSPPTPTSCSTQRVSCFFSRLPRASFSNANQSCFHPSMHATRLVSEGGGSSTFACRQPLSWGCSGCVSEVYNRGFCGDPEERAHGSRLTGCISIGVCGAGRWEPWQMWRRSPSCSAGTSDSEPSAVAPTQTVLVPYFGPYSNLVVAPWGWGVVGCWGTLGCWDVGGCWGCWGCFSPAYVGQPPADACACQRGRVACQRGRVACLRVCVACHKP
jgi:hypothetical protein